MRPAGSPGAPALLGALGLLGLASLAAAFSIWTASSGWSFACYLMLAAVLILLPGHFLLCLLRVDAPLLERLALSGAAGLSLGNAAYWLCAYLGEPRLFWAWPVALLLGCVHPRLRPRVPRGTRARVRYSHGLLLIVLGAAVVPLFVSPLYFRNLARLPGDRLAFYPLADVVANVSIASELTHSVPPQNPYLPGRPLSYHYGMHLTAALFACFGLPVADLAVRYLPVSFMALTVLTGYCLARHWLGSQPLAALVALLVVLGEDFSFVPGLLLGSAEPWAVHFLGIPATVSLYLLNPMLPALGFVFVVLICHKRYLDGRRAAWLVLAALASATLVSYKVFAAAQLLAALGVSGVLYAVVFRSRAALASAGAVGLATVPLLLASAAADSSVAVSIEPWPYVPAALLRMGVAGNRPAQLALGFYRGEASLLGAAAYYALALPGYLVLTLGARVVGAAAWARSLLRPSPADAPRSALAVLVLLGPPLSLLTALTAAGYPARQHVNNSVWFFVLSKQLMWFFAVEPLRRLSRPAALAGAAGLVALAVPSTAQFLWLQSADRVPALERPVVEMLDFLEREVPPGASCLAREEIAHAILVTTRCRALALDVFSYAALPPQRQAELRRVRDLFWQRWQAGEVQADALQALGVDYVVVDASRDGLLAAQPGRRAPEDGPRLEWRFRNHGFAVLRVGRQGPSAPPAADILLPP